MSSNFLIGLVFIAIVLFMIAKIIKLIFKLFKKKNYETYSGSLHSKKPQSNSNKLNEIIKPPTILSDVMQSGLWGRIFTIFFLEDGLVFVKTGSGTTDIAGSQRAFHGGYGATANITSGIGKLLDLSFSNKRGEAAVEVASYAPDDMVKLNKYNFKISYKNVSKVEIKKPGFIGEMKIILYADSIHKFKVNTNSEFLIKYYQDTFERFLPGKVTVI